MGIIVIHRHTGDRHRTFFVKMLCGRFAASPWSRPRMRHGAAHRPWKAATTREWNGASKPRVGPSQRVHRVEFTSTGSATREPMSTDHLCTTAVQNMRGRVQQSAQSQRECSLTGVILMELARGTVVASWSDYAPYPPAPDTRRFVRGRSSRGACGLLVVSVFGGCPEHAAKRSREHARRPASYVPARRVNRFVCQGCRDMGRVLRRYGRDSDRQGLVGPAGRGHYARGRSRDGVTAARGGLRLEPYDRP